MKFAGSRWKQHRVNVQLILINFILSSSFPERGGSEEQILFRFLHMYMERKKSGI